MNRLKYKHEIPNYEEKAKVLTKNGWETWYNDDNWIKTEWHNQGKKVDMMGLSTEDAYDSIIENLNSKISIGDTVEVFCEFLISQKFIHEVKDIKDGWVIFDESIGKIQIEYCTKV